MSLNAYARSLFEGLTSLWVVGLGFTCVDRLSACGERVQRFGGAGWLGAGRLA
jgi:hypothetical protein